VGDFNVGTFWFDQTTGMLYWTNDHSYHMGTSDLSSAPVLYAAKLDGNVLSHRQNWYLPQSAERMEKYWGGVTVASASFANTYLGGRRLLLGFGGAYATNGALYSHGPSLGAVSINAAGVIQNDFTAIMDYHRGEPCVRDGNYFSLSSPDKNPVLPWAGLWQGDDIRSGVFIDLPDKKGYLTFVRQTAGRVSYDYGGVNIFAVAQNAWYFYDFKTLGAAAVSGNVRGLAPSSFSTVEYPYDSATAALPVNLLTNYHHVRSSCFDPETRLLYLNVTNTANYGLAFYAGGQPFVHVYRVKEG
jgi:hypothetical protein